MLDLNGSDELVKSEIWVGKSQKPKKKLNDDEKRSQPKVCVIHEDSFSARKEAPFSGMPASRAQKQMKSVCLPFSAVKLWEFSLAFYFLQFRAVRLWKIFALICSATRNQQLLVSQKTKEIKREPFETR